MKADRQFYTAAGALFLVLTVVGFKQYIFGGKHADGSPIDPAMLAIVIAHSAAIFAWFVLFFVQSLLISVRSRGLHMKLGWSVLLVAPTIAVTGPVVATRSVRLVPGQVIFDWPGPQFLLVMYAEIALYVAFVTIGVLNRKRPRIHRPMMLMASLSIVTGATGRMQLMKTIFGDHHWTGIFGPVVAIGAILLLLHWALTRKFEREFALSFAVLLFATVVVSALADTVVWSNLAGLILRP